MSIIHPGTSINFDGTDLQRSEEEEIHQEDIKQQQEVLFVKILLLLQNFMKSSLRLHFIFFRNLAYKSILLLFYLKNSFVTS